MDNISDENITNAKAMHLSPQKPHSGIHKPKLIQKDCSWNLVFVLQHDHHPQGSPNIDEHRSIFFKH